MADNKFETQYTARPELGEVFADHLEKFVFDGNTLRIELCINRLDLKESSDKPTGQRVPVSRLVLTPSAAIDLHNKLRKLVGAMEKQGLIKKKDAASGKDPGTTKKVQ